MTWRIASIKHVMALLLVLLLMLPMKLVALVAGAVVSAEGSGGRRTVMSRRRAHSALPRPRFAGGVAEFLLAFLKPLKS